jgi:DNA-binding NarL/FixJ family response regulator
MLDKKEEYRIGVLLVMHDPMLLETTADCLNFQGGLNIETALSTDEAETKMKKTKPDVVVCDLDMPLTNSFDFLKKLREKGDKTPLIFLAANGEKELTIKAQCLGANGSVEKYGDPNVVYPTLKKCIVSVIRKR